MEMRNVKPEQISPSNKASNQSFSGYLPRNGGTGADGKVSKKRSRASKRTPTTVLNTDTSNFKAMVQHFTGAPPHPNIFPPKSLGGYDFFLPNKTMAVENNICISPFNVAKSSSAPYDFLPQSDIGAASFMNFINERPEGQQNYVTELNSSALWDEVLRLEYPTPAALRTHME